MPVFNFLSISWWVLDGLILSPQINEPLKYSPKLNKAFVNADQNLLLKNLQISPLQQTSAMEKNEFIWDVSFSINLGTSLRKISFTKRRPRNKQRTKKLQRKYYCSTSRKMLHAVFVLEIRLFVPASNWLFSLNIKL